MPYSAKGLANISEYKSNIFAIIHTFDYTKKYTAGKELNSSWRMQLNNIRIARMPKLITELSPLLISLWV